MEELKKRENVRSKKKVDAQESKENVKVDLEKMTFTVKQVAKLIGISERSVYKNLLPLPGFPVVKIGKRIVILREEFKKFLENNTGLAS